MPDKPPRRPAPLRPQSTCCASRSSPTPKSRSMPRPDLKRRLQGFILIHCPITSYVNLISSDKRILLPFLSELRQPPHCAPYRRENLGKARRAAGSIANLKATSHFSRKRKTPRTRVLTTEMRGLS